LARCRVVQTRRLARREDVVLVISLPLPPWEELSEAGSRLGAIQSSENYRLYRLHYDLLDATAEAARCEGFMP
jgi:hypothetical protein